MTNQSSADPDLPRIPHYVLRDLVDAESWIGSWWVASLWAGTTAALAVAARRAHGHLGSRALAGLAWTSAGVTILAAANARGGYAPTLRAARVGLSGWGVGTPTGDRGGPGRGATQAERVPVSEDLRLPRSLVWVYTPPGYRPGVRRYPVAYLFHGSIGRSVDWFGAGQIAHVMDVLVGHGLIQPMIVVAPETNGRGPSSWDTEGLDSTTGGSQVETYLTKVVVPWVDAHYDTVPDPAYRIIGGMSAGAFAALNLGLKHPDLFGPILSIEGFTDPGRGGRRMLATEDEFLANSPAHYGQTVTSEDPAPVFFVVAEKSTWTDERAMADFAEVLRAQGREVVLRVEKGIGHTWTMARRSVVHALIFASARVPEPVLLCRNALSVH